MDKLIVTRHPALVDHLIDLGLASAETPVLAHATAQDVSGCHVLGVLPLHLAAAATSVTEVPLAIPAEMRGRELSLAEVRRYAGPAVTYAVTVRGAV
jgi:hypothetical protein